MNEFVLVIWKKKAEKEKPYVFFPDSADACPKFIDCPLKGLICWLGLAWLEVPKHPISSSVESGQHIMNQFLPGASTWPRSCEILWPHRHVQSCMWILVCVGTRDVWRPQVDSLLLLLLFIIFLFLVLGVEPRALHMLDRRPDTDAQPSVTNDYKVCCSYLLYER